ncbi:MAG: hypothetical protein KAW02_04050 [candidate division Zixibacteria bacterium]|nr:hypothetical protein [candidate division Zixibacteria bacterium]
MSYQVLKFNLQNLRNSFSNQHIPRENLNQFSKLNYLHRYLRELRCATMVIEHDYVDGDYLDDYTQYYAKCFKPYERFCRRLHFFSAEFNRKQFTSLIEKKIPNNEEERFVKNYLGFAVAKPLPEAIIGRTVLKTYPLDGGRRNFHGIREYQVNLYGIKFKIDSLAFHEQDTVVGACATSALWSAFQKTCHLFGKEAPTPATITQLGTRHILSSRALPSHGLSVEQICEAVRAVGLEPEVYKVNPSVPVVSLIYAYLRAGLPAILAINVQQRGLHGVTVLGYSIEEGSVRETEVLSGYRMPPLMGLRISKLYAHDDQIGPFARMIIHPGAEQYPVRFKGTWSTLHGQDAWLDPVYVIVPVYHKIRIKFLEVLKWPHRLTQFFQFLGLTSTSGPLRLRWDIFLSTVNELKNSLRVLMPNSQLLKCINVRSHPRFIWRVRAYHETVPLFEMLVDATDIARSFFPYLVWFEHLGMRNVIRSQVGRRDWDEAVTRYLSSKFVKLFREAVA